MVLEVKFGNEDVAQVWSTIIEPNSELAKQLLDWAGEEYVLSSISVNDIGTVWSLWETYTEENEYYVLKCVSYSGRWRLSCLKKGNANEFVQTYFDHISGCGDR